MTAGQKFAQTPQADVNRSSFNRDHSLKTTFDADLLIPILVDEVLPGDTHKLKANLFGRLATPINPIMDNMYLDTFYFFVPMRLVWDNYAKFFGEQQNPDSSTDFLIPTSTGTLVANSVYDYMGLPIGNETTFNNLPIRAYWLIYDEWFRDQNLQESANINRGDTGIIQNVLYNPSIPIARGKRHDYFTSCLPFAQKGDAAFIPLGDKALVMTNASNNGPVSVLQEGGFFINDNRYLTASTSFTNKDSTASRPNGGELYADLTTATGANINEWRQAFQIQKFLERDARGGTRYTEKVKSHFGVTSPDSRLQRPEYLGGSSAPINVHPVPQTSSTDATTPQGNLGAFGTVAESGSGFTKSFTEHGYIIGLANVRADLTYQQGLDKLWSRSTQFDFYFPTFAHLGEQAVLNKEIYHQATAADNLTFGYQERYSEYKYKKSYLAGLFRSSAAASLDSWHLSQDFATLPTLGTTFIKSNTPVDRVIAVPAEPHIILDCYFNYTSVRPIPVFSPPGMIDHF